MKDIDPNRRRYAHGDALLMAAVGFMLGYVVTVGHAYSHLLHWAWSGGTAVFAYLAWLAWAYRPGDWPGTGMGGKAERRDRGK